MTRHIDPTELGGFERRLLAVLTRIDQQRPPTPQRAPAPTPAPHRGPGRPRLRRALLGAAVLAGLLALTTTAVATWSDHTDLEVGGAAAPGGVVVVKGAGCRVGSVVAFSLDGKLRLGVAKAAAEGLFIAELRVPAATSLGGHTLTAVCTNGDGKRLVQQDKLLVTEPKPEPPAGPAFDVGGAAAPGGVVVVKGAGCRVGSVVAFSLDGKLRLGVAKAAAEGLFIAELRVPATTSLGGHTLTAVCTGRDGKRLVQRAKLPVTKAEPGPPSAPKR